MGYEWISKKEVVKHINKHVLNTYNECDNEEKRWEKEFSKLKYKDLKGKPNKVIENHELFDQYKLKSNEVTSNENFCYIFKSGDNYSCNYKRKDELTTCLRIDYDDVYPEAKIISCFFRYSTVVDATVILYVTKYLNDNEIKSVNFQVKGLFLNETNFEYARNAISKVAQDNYNNEPKLKVALRFVSEYLKRQYDYYTKEDKPIEQYEYFKYLIATNRNIHKISLSEKEKLLNQISLEKNKILDIYKVLDLEYKIMYSAVKFLDLCECSINTIGNEKKFEKEAEKIICSF